MRQLGKNKEGTVQDDVFDDQEDFFLDDKESIEESGPPGLAVKDFSSLVISPSDWTVETLVSQIGKQIDLEPEFQRRNVWSYEAKSRFIESLLLGIPIPQILLSSKEGVKGGYLVLDGKQRLLTLKEFIDGKRNDGKAFRLVGLRILDVFEGKTWTQISEDIDWKYRLLNETLRTAVIRGWKREKVLYEIFFRLNSGSVKLSPMELRMSLHPGSFLKYVIEWTEHIGPLHKLLNKTRPDARMADVELAVRYMGFSMSNVVYGGDLKEFLDSVTIHLNNVMDDEKNGKDLVSLQLDRMNMAISAGMSVFGDKRFCRKFTGKGYEVRFNRAIFDILVGSLAHPKVAEFAQENPQEFRAAFEAVSQDNDFIRSIETTTKSPAATYTRFSTWYAAVKKLTGIKVEMPLIHYEITN